MADSADGGRWEEAPGTGDGSVRWDWIPDEQPPSPDGGPGVWHIVAEPGLASRWEWFPTAPPPMPSAPPPARSHPPVEVSRTPVVFEVDFDTRMSRGLTGPDRDRLINQSATWERVRSRLADGEKRWAVTAVGVGNPGDPRFGAKPYAHGFAFATDQRLILDISTTPDRWEPEHWHTIDVRYSRVVAFGASHEFESYMRLILIADADETADGLDIDNIHIKAIENADFWDWYLTVGMLMKRDGCAEARPEYRAWLAKKAAQLHTGG